MNVVKLLLKILKSTGLISKILPALLRAWAEGGLGEPARKFYWLLEGKKTLIGALLVGLAYGLEAICGANPEMVWGCEWSRYVMAAGALLTSIGLVDAGVRSPWPKGTAIPPEAKR